MDNWEQQQQHHYRSQSVSIPSSQASQSQSQYAGPSQYADYGQQHYDRRQPTYPIPPLQLNPSTFLHSEPPRNLPSSSLPPNRHRTQSVALTAIGQRERSYPPSSSYPRPPPGYPEATVPISRHGSSSRSWTMPYPNDVPAEPQVPYISSVMSPYAQPGVPSRVMPPLSEIDRRGLAAVDESPRPKPHVCDQCGAAFSRAHDLKRHVETHKGDRPHKCPTCTKAFSRKDALQRHQSMAQCGVDTQESY